jgi:HAD superfamily hydrolase (TIGR01509 family)
MATARGTILDVDGTLLDSNDAHAESWVETFRESGIERTFADVRPLIGMGGDQILRRLTVLDPDSGEGRALSERRSHLFLARYLPLVKPFPDTRALLERMKRDGLELVVASSAREDELEALLDAATVTDLVDRRTSSDETKESKPAPDVVAAAVAKTGFRADELIMLGDTPFDVRAAERAGVPIVALRSGGWDDAALEGALAVYDDPHDLLLQYDGSPFVREDSGAFQSALNKPRAPTHPGRH